MTLRTQADTNAPGSRARSQEWGTPRHIFDPLHAEFQFQHDVAASDENHLLPTYWTIKDDALSQEWRGTVWCNPPYKYTEQFVRKAVAESVLGTTTVMLVPVRPHTRWWHELVVAGDIEIRWILGRFKFVGAPYSAPFPCCILVVRPLVAKSADRG